MRISRERSGNAGLREANQNQGRGEYEWADLQPDDPTRDQLLNKRIMLRLPDSVLLDTACLFDSAQGKWRTRTADDARADRYIYPIYHLAVALLMPCPTRQYANVGSGLPVLRHEEYFIEDILSGAIVVTDTNADYTAQTVIIANQSVVREDITIADRFGMVRQIWARRFGLSREIAALIQEHESLVRGGDQISIDGRRLISDIQRATAEASIELEIGACTSRTDPLSTLLRLADLEQADPLLTPFEEIPPERLEIRRREIARRRRLAATRGPECLRFRRQVRDAYHSSCIVCGLRLPSFWDDGKAGVDAAHILPDSEFDMNHISNGVCLCKIHHWAFDEGLIEIVHDAVGYSVVIPPEAEARAVSQGFDMDFLRPNVGAIPSGRLPHAVASRPNPECLRRLRELLHP